MGQKQAKKTGGAMSLVNVSEEVMEVFEMTGFADMLCPSATLSPACRGVPSIWA